MLSEKIVNIPLSGTMEISSKMIEMKARGIEVLDLCVGEPDLPTPEHIKAAAQKAINENRTKYTLNSGITELREAVCVKFKNEYNAQYNSDEVIITNGAKQAIYNTLQVIINPMDEVLLPLPYYVSYSEMIKLAGGIPKFIKTKRENSYKITLEELRANISENTKALILCNPNNPTGSVFSESELQKILDFALSQNIFVVSDEIYEKLVYGNTVFKSTAAFGPEFKNNLVVINGVSKSYSMTGWRIGYAVAKKEIISGMNKLQSHSTSNACTISQYAALEALTGPQEVVENQRKIFEERRDLIQKELNKIDSISYVEPLGAFYFFIDISQILKKSESISSSREFCINLLNESYIGTVPGSVFGMEGFLRISYAKSKEVLSEATRRMRESITVAV
jgi:aspartate aminotransferase